MSLNKAPLVALAAALLLMKAQTTFADSGSFRSVRSYHHEYITIDHGTESFTGGILRGTKTIVDSSGGPFVAGANSYVVCLAFSRATNDGIALQAPCTSTDADGDTLYSRAIRRVGDVTVGGGGGVGTRELLGGTGKYEGITGSCSYTTEYLEGQRVAVLSDCTWSRS